MRPALRPLTSGSAALATTLALAACGGGGTKNVAQRTTATAATAPAPTRIHIVSPRPGSHTGATLVVSVRLTGAQPASSPVLRYMLDGHLTRTGPTRVTLHRLAPGRHRLEVLLAGDAAVHSASVFTVRAPAAPVPVAPVPAPAPETMAHEQAPPPTMGGSESHQEAPPPPKREAPPPPKTETTPPPAEGGIPQGGGGDHDGDNSGGPSDGDGNV